MGNDSKPHDRPQTCVRVSVSIAPISDADERLADMLGAFAFDLGQLVGCADMGSRASVECTEETWDALENNLFSSGELKIDMTVTGADAQVRCVVTPDAGTSGTEAWFPPDQAEQTSTVENTMMKTIRRKRADLAKGGLGLMRMKSETKKRVGGPDDRGGSSPASANVVALPPPKKPQ
jgi:hypothetical protein